MMTVTRAMFPELKMRAYNDNKVSDLPTEVAAKEIYCDLITALALFKNGFLELCTIPCIANAALSDQHC